MAFFQTAGAIMSLLGGASALYGALQGPEEMLPQNMNKAQTAELLRRVNDAITQAQAGRDVAMADIERLNGELNQFKAGIANVRRDQEALRAPDQNQAWQNYLNRVPELRQIAEDVAREATSPYGDQREIAQRRAEEASRMALESSAGAGNLYAGQALRAATEAAGGQLAGYEQGLANQYGQAYANQFGQSSGMEQQLARQDVQQEFANEMARYQALAQSFGQQAGITGQQQGVALGQAQLFNDSLNNQQNIQAQLMGPQFATPQLVSNQFGAIGQGLAGLGAGMTGLGQTFQADAGLQGRNAAAKSARQETRADGGNIFQQLSAGAQARQGYQPPAVQQPVPSYEEYLAWLQSRGV